MTAAGDNTEALLHRWHAGDRTALHGLVERNREWIEARVRNRRGEALRRHAETVDDFQDLVVRVLEYSPRFVTANRQQFRGLVARMIENLLTDRARRLRRRSFAELTGELKESRVSLDPAVKVVTEPGEAAARNEELAWMRLGLEFLSDEDRGLVERRQLEDESFLAIAEQEGSTPDAVRMRFNRALLRLAGIVQRLQEGGLDGMLDAGD